MSSEALGESALGRALLKQLLAGVRNRGLYPPHHPEVAAPAHALVETLSGPERSGPDVTLAIIDGDAYLDGQPLREASVQYADFLARLEDAGVELLRFMLGVSADEAMALVNALARDPADVVAAGGLAALLDADGVQHITSEHLVRLPDGRFELLQHLGSEESEEGETGTGTEEDTEEASDEEEHPLTPPEGAQRAYAGAVGDVGAVFDTIANTGRINTSLLASAAENLVSDLLNDQGAFLGLLHLRSVGEDLFQHALNVALLTVLIAAKLELDEEQLRLLGIAALLHDVGELFVPRDLREKAGPLTEDEWHVVRQHPARGAKLLLATAGLEPVVATVALEHHAGYQGQGYPKLRSRQRPHLFSRIVAVADAYDALTHPRPYQPEAANILATERLLQLSGSVFDPSIIKILLHSIGFYPPGTPVRLTDGRTGVVESPSPGQPFLPRVLVQTADGFEVVDTSVLDVAGRPLIQVETRLGPGDVPAPAAVTQIEAPLTG